MSDDRSQSDQQQKQPKDKRTQRLFKKLRNPRTLFFLFRLGVGSYKLVKWVVEFLEL